LVVIAIIAILAAILFPVFARAREKARQASCESNLKQIGLAFGMYSTDYDGYWPNCYPVAYSDQNAPSLDCGWSGWISNALRPYTKNQQLFICPSAANGSWGDPFNNGAVVGYCFDYVALWGVKDSVISNSAAGISNVTAMWDSANAWADGYGPIYTRDIAWYLAQDWSYTCWHNEMNNFLFADGHVKAAKWSSFTWDQIWGATGGMSASHPDYGRSVLQPMVSPPY
jgi:prepilin-type processing-associated H-X9-DG protein